VSSEYALLPPIEESTYHSVNAYLDNLEQKITIDTRVFYQLVHAYFSPHVSSGVTAFQMAVWCGMKEHKSIGASLSRLRKKYPNDVGYTRRTGETHGVYFYTGGEA